MTIHTDRYLSEATEIIGRIDRDSIERLAGVLADLRRRGGRLFVLGVGGGDAVRNVSPNLVKGLEYAKRMGAVIMGIVGRDGGFTARVADVCVIVPTVNAAAVTPHTEAFQAVIWHLLVSHPALQASGMKWESTR